MEDLDRYENILYGIVGDEFLVDFMGSVYRKVGVDFSNQEAQYAKLAEKFQDEIIQSSVHEAGIREDAKLLLEKAGMDIHENVWEIQVDEDQLVLLVMGNKNKKIKEIHDDIKIYVGEVNQNSCIGLIKAACYGKRNHISLARLLMECT